MKMQNKPTSMKTNPHNDPNCLRLKISFTVGFNRSSSSGIGVCISSSSSFSLAYKGKPPSMLLMSVPNRSSSHHISDFSGSMSSPRFKVDGLGVFLVEPESSGVLPPEVLGGAAVARFMKREV